jgi:hypothetical protein
MRSVSRVSGLFALAVVAGLVSTAAADGPLDVSIASPLLKSKAQIRILSHDDGLTAGCTHKAFDSAAIITQPAFQGGNRGRKWQEQWVLNRCGTKVGYRVFFTDVGEGGAYFAFQRTD